MAGKFDVALLQVERTVGDGGAVHVAAEVAEHGVCAWHDGFDVGDPAGAGGNGGDGDVGWQGPACLRQELAGEQLGDRDQPSRRKTLW